MRSYAYVDSIEDKIVKCELELVSIENTSECDRNTRVMVELSLEHISEQVDNVEESDILVVEHDSGNLISIYGKDDAEKQRRIEEMELILGE